MVYSTILVSRSSGILRNCNINELVRNTYAANVNSELRNPACGINSSYATVGERDLFPKIILKIKNHSDLRSQQLIELQLIS